MKICMAQTRAVKGDIQENIKNHERMIATAISHGARIIIFPELSITGYEPALAESLAMDSDDHRLDAFQEISNANQITIGVGVPTKQRDGVCISLIVFQPGAPRKIYSKKYLHPDEEPFFISGENFPVIRISAFNLALAICYEISIQKHAKTAFENGAEIYIASVAKSVMGVNYAERRLSKIAKEYSAPVLMSNCVGKSDGFDSGGKSSVWDCQGILIGQLDAISEGILVYDSETQEVAY